jgi:hypothetical protein
MGQAVYRVKGREKAVFRSKTTRPAAMVNHY